MRIMIIESCLLAMMWSGGFLHNTAVHESEINTCISSVNHYVTSHCPIPTEPHTEWQKRMWMAIEAVSKSTSKSDKEALTAACSDQYDRY
jgi:hypothetical protein